MASEGPSSPAAADGTQIPETQDPKVRSLHGRGMRMVLVIKVNLEAFSPAQV